MRVTPFSHYFVLMEMSSDFQNPSTIFGRRYLCEWEIAIDRFYLIRISATYDYGTEVTLGGLFPGYDNRVFAFWYSDASSIPQVTVVESTRRLNLLDRIAREKGQPVIGTGSKLFD
jgi:hypothetical protein